jgi:predicted NBD/HSP70 family sugar kinase
VSVDPPNRGGDRAPGDRASDDRIPDGHGPRIRPALDPGFDPAFLARRATAERVRRSGVGVPVAVAVEQPDGSAWVRETLVFPGDHPAAAASFHDCERLLKFMLWARGGHRVHVDGPPWLVDALIRHYAEAPTGVFDARLADEFHGHGFEVVRTPRAEFPDAPEARATAGGHHDGCRIGFDLGASDRKVAAVIDGEVVFSEEVAWDPARHADPQWHVDEIMASLRAAADHLPRVDAIGGSAAGVYVDNEVRAASLFRSVPRDLFETRVRGIFTEIRRAWGDVPFVVANDGDVTALAGSLQAGSGALLGIAMGSSEAAGYVTRDGHLTSWLNELAFAPVDHATDAPVDEWSGDRGCGALYFSQQATGRLLGPAGLAADAPETLPEQLVFLQELMAAGDQRAADVYRTIGTYLGYGVLHYADFYAIDHILLLGRVMTGPGGDLVIGGAREVLRAEEPATAERIVFHAASERDKRHGQAVTAAGLPIGDRDG